MTFSFEHVTDESVSIQELSCAVSFLSSSDALLSAVLLKHMNTSWELVDDVLTLFKNRSFCTQDVTFSMAEDIYDRVRDQRRASANTRDSDFWTAQIIPVAQHTPSSCLISPLIAELVAEQIYSEIDPLYDADDEWGWCYSGRRLDWRPVSTVEESLRSMSLVHRSWTGIAQRCLRRRICVWSQLELHNLFHSPQIGPWVRELSYRENRDDYAMRRQSMLVVPRLLCGILQRCPNLKRVLLEVEHLPVISFFDHRFINQLGSLTFLENIWLHQIRDGSRNVYINFMELFSVLEKLRHLKSLSLENLDALIPLNPAGCFSQFLKYCPDLPIDSMSFVGNYAPDASTEYFTWLIKSQQKLPSTKLEISFRLLMDILEKHPELSMANVTKLQIRLQSFTIEEVTAVLQRFSSVQSLILVVSDISVPDGHPVIPETVTFLHVHIDRTLLLYDRLKPERSFVNPMLEASSKLRAVTISAARQGLKPQSPYADGTEVNEVIDVDAIYPFDSTFEYCDEKGIEFHLIQAKHPPTFDEHSTDSTRKIILPYYSSPEE